MMLQTHGLDFFVTMSLYIRFFANRVVGKDIEDTIDINTFLLDLQKIYQEYTRGQELQDILNKWHSGIFKNETIEVISLLL